ncbi:MAG TPA: hypothetical protein VF527_10680, partial [Pyrinomonadaceae bacterium]
PRFLNTHRICQPRPAAQTFDETHAQKRLQQFQITLDLRERRLADHSRRLFVNGLEDAPPLEVVRAQLKRLHKPVKRHAHPRAANARREKLHAPPQSFFPRRERPDESANIHDN